MMRWLAVLWLVVVTGCAKTVPPTMVPDNVVVAETDDGWALDVRHYPAAGPPVLLVHGMGANHYNWDYREEVSLAHYLQERGWDVWVPELRGDPGSVPPDPKAARRFSFDDHAERDMPAIIDAVLAATGEQELAWVGHSMGGMLLYTTLATRPEVVEAGVAVCSPAEMRRLVGVHKRLRGMGWATKGQGRYPAASLARLTSPLGRLNPLYRRLGNREHYDWPVANGMARRALVDLPRPMVHQATTWLKTGHLLHDDGSTHWLTDRDTADVDVPLLVFGGAIDKVVPHPNVEAACDVFDQCTYRLLGTEGGFSSDYGHVDPIVGNTARTEVYPLIEQFLARQVEGAPAEASVSSHDGAGAP